MPVQKQEFYEGAALYILARNNKLENLCYDAPFFLINDKFLIYLKYCTKSRSPWAFTFLQDEQALLNKKSIKLPIFIALICGADGVAALPYVAFQELVIPSESSVRIACFRKHGEYYEVKGPDGKLEKRIAPSAWQKILDE